MILKPIDIPRTSLRNALVEHAEEVGLDDLFQSYRCDDYDSDSTYVFAVQALTEWLSNDNHANPFDNVGMTLVADVDGVIDGYEFSYSLWSPPSVRQMPVLWLGSSFYRWKDIRGEHHGIRGVIDFLENVIAALNTSIAGFNAWSAA
jgi:hypothetical protein